jgi:hypothetical protein
MVIVCQQQKQIKDMVRTFQKGKPIPQGAYMVSADFSDGMSFINLA